MAQLNKTQQFLDEVLKRVPEDQREGVRSMYSAASDEARSLEDAMARVNETAVKQKEWWESNSAALTEYKTLKAAGGGGNGNHTIDADAIAKQIEASRDEVLGQGLSLMTIGTSIAVGHIHEFGEALDMGTLTQEAIAAKLPLADYYNQKIAPRRKERADAALAKQLEEAEARGRKAGVEETLAKVPGGGMPYPVNGGSMPVSTLSGLMKPAEGAAKVDVVGDAARTAMEVAARAAQ